MYNQYEILVIASILCFGGALFCLIAYIVEKYLDDAPENKKQSVNINPKMLDEYNQTVDRR